MSFIARIVMTVTIFVLVWISFDAFMKFYVMWQLSSEQSSLIDPRFAEKAQDLTKKAANLTRDLGNHTLVAL